MLIWDYDNQEHIIRINGIEQDRLRNSDFAGNITQIERKVKERVDGIVNSLGYQFYLHVISKVPVDYMMWLGPILSEPIAPPGYDWWEAIP